MSTQHHVAVVGLGYMGLPMATLLAIHKNKVTGIDIDPEKVESLKKGICHFSEPGLQEALDEAIATNNLSFSTTMVSADFYIIAVPTPFVASTHTSDLAAVRAASTAVAKAIKPGAIVILESTVPPATCDTVVNPIIETISGLRAGKDFYTVHCPERAYPGKTMHEIVHNDRIVGCDDAEVGSKVAALYGTFVKGAISITTSATAEMAKLMENTYRDVNIALANEFAKIAENNNVNIWQAIALANLHPRVNIHLPGPGVGGHCIAIDPWFLTETSENTPLIRNARMINDGMPMHVLRIARKHLKAEAQKVTILGVAYKPNVDDARETPAEHVATLFKQQGLTVAAHDPHVTKKESPIPLSELEDAVTNSSALILVTNHTEYESLDPKKMGKLMKNKLVIDTRNQLNHEAWQAAGFTVVLLGDGTR